MDRASSTTLIILDLLRFRFLKTMPTTLLFGDDMAKTMQEVKAINQITQQIAARPPRLLFLLSQASPTSSRVAVSGHVPPPPFSARPPRRTQI